VLRRHALLTQKSERGNLEGAAAFAVLAPRAHRACVLRAVVAFQATYDYIDTLAEQPCADPVANGRQLHLALVAALEPEGEHADYYEHSAGAADDGYMRKLVDRCRFALRALPSYALVADSALRCARRMVAYQALNHAESSETRGALAGWASTLTPTGTGLRWWETAAAAASSLSVFALIAAAAQPILESGQAAATESAYFPWIGALHILLDSLIDRGEDATTGQHCLVDHYVSAEEAAVRMSVIATRATRATELLPERRARDDPHRDDELLSVLPHGVGAGRVPGRRACAPQHGRDGGADDGRTEGTTRGRRPRSATPLDALTRVALALETQVLDFPLARTMFAADNLSCVKLDYKGEPRTANHVQVPLSSRQ
jgi:tetraprenyl-beta-curcumene synthase